MSTINPTQPRAPSADKKKKKTTAAMPHRNNSPVPSLNLQIPSMHDFLALDARVYLSEAYGQVPPTTAATAASAHWRRKLAVFAHPYAPLGGSYDDPVVLSVVNALLQEGWVVVSFNFRGADRSKGKTTWTGMSETKDYVSVVIWALAYAQSLPPPPSALPSPGLDGGVGSEEQEREREPAEEMELLLGGYSYGSLIASRVPDINLLENVTNETPFSQAVKTARLSGSRWLDTHSSERTSYSGVFNRAQVLGAIEAEQSRKIQCERETQKGSRKWKVVTRYMLVSPLLPPISSFMMGFGAETFWGAAKSMVGLGNHHGKQKEEEGWNVSGIEGEHVRVLVVYGDGDVFTGVGKYRKWVEKMIEVRGKGVFKAVEVHGAGHFWREECAIDGLLEAIRDWVR